MRTILTAMILTATMGLFGQVQIQLHEGDHVYFLDNFSSIPVHYQICPANKNEIIEEYLQISENGVPACEIFFDPDNFKTITLQKGEDGTMYVGSIESVLFRSVIATNTDPGSQPIFHNGRVVFTESRYLTINTPHLSRATSFKLATNNRVFVFVKQPASLTAKKL